MTTAASSVGYRAASRARNSSCTPTESPARRRTLPHPIRMRTTLAVRVCSRVGGSSLPDDSYLIREGLVELLPAWRTSPWWLLAASTTPQWPRPRTSGPMVAEGGSLIDPKPQARALAGQGHQQEDQGNVALPGRTGPRDTQTAARRGAITLMGPIDVLNVDDSARFLSAARELIAATPGFRTVGEAASGRDGVEAARR